MTGVRTRCLSPGQRSPALCVLFSLCPLHSTLASFCCCCRRPSHRKSLLCCVGQIHSHSTSRLSGEKGKGYVEGGSRRLRDHHNVLVRRRRLAEKRRGNLHLCWHFLGARELKLHLLLLTSVGGERSVCTALLWLSKGDFRHKSHEVPHCHPHHVTEGLGFRYTMWVSAAPDSRILEHTTQLPPSQHTSTWNLHTLAFFCELVFSSLVGWGTERGQRKASRRSRRRRRRVAQLSSAGSGDLSDLRGLPQCHRPHHALRPAISKRLPIKTRGSIQA